LSTQLLDRAFGSPSAIIPKIGEAPVIDGDPDDRVWGQSPLFVLGFLNGDARKPAQRTEARMLLDAKNLYVGFTCWESDMTGLTAAKKERDANLWGDDNISLFLSPGHTHNPDYFHIIVNTDGVTHDAKVVCDTRWNPELTLKIRKREDAWTVEMAIPLAEMLEDPERTPRLWGG
jgi:hypothetical protein